MTRMLSTSRLELAAGLLTWAVVSALVVYVLLGAAPERAAMLPLAVVLMGFNLLAMLVASRNDRSPGALNYAAHWLQLASVFALGWLVPVDFLPIYTIIWIAQATSLYGIRICWTLLALVIAAWYAIMRFSWDDSGAAFGSALFGTFHLFALISARTAVRAEEARNRAEALNRELVATQHLLSEASRQSERTRIARDLHDLLGHHLTALSINLQIAERVSDGEAKSKIEECRALARLLLSDVRDAVSTLRDESAVDFGRAVRLLTENTPSLDVRLTIDEDLRIDDVETAESLLRCIQEAVTNTLRHSGAKQSFIRLWQEGDRIHLEVHDDGRASQVAEGNGLVGMRERIAALQGSLDLDKVGEALRVRVQIPVRG